MDINQFWKIIEQVKDAERPEEALAIQLQSLLPEELIKFQENFDEVFYAAYRWDIWGAAYLINGGCSDDGFMDFRYALISMGRNIYDKALANPDSLVDLLDPDEEDEITNEDFAYVASQVYEKKTGEEFIPRIPRDFSTLEENMGEYWDFEDNEETKQRLPTLFTFVEKHYWSE